MEIPSPKVVFKELEEQGTRRKYDMLVAALKKHNSTPFIQEELLITLIREVHQNVVKLDRQNSAIAHEIMKLQWQTGGEGLVESYMALMLDLVSAHTGIYLHDCLCLIIKNFKPMQGSNKTQTYTQTYKHNHQLLANISVLVPKVTLDLQGLLPTMFLHHNIHKHIQTTFTTNMFHLTTYLPSLRPIIIKLILKLLTELDTRATRKEIMASIGDSGDDKITKIGDAPMEEEEEDEMKLKTADTLDNLMCIFFAYIEQTCFNKGVLKLAETKELYMEVMQSFQSLLLTPSMTTHTQFTLFYLCSLHKSIEDDFLQVLWHTVTSPSQETVYRQLASLYLTELLSRANFISQETIQQHLTRMRNWIESYSENTNDSHKQLHHQQQQRHSPFYFLSQAFFHLFVCRHRIILDSPNGHSFLMSLYPQRIAFCRLNPLKHCLPSVADAFCAVVRNNQIAFCDTVLERNRRQLTSASTTSSLLSYSPFDPFLLKKSKVYVTPLYQEYDNTAFHPDHLHCHLREDMEYLDLEDIGSFSPKHSSLFNHHMITAMQR